MYIRTNIHIYIYFHYQYISIGRAAIPAMRNALKGNFKNATAREKLKLRGLFGGPGWKHNADQTCSKNIEICAQIACLDREIVSI